MTRLSDGARTRIRARELGFVFQSYNLVPTLTAAENVALAADYAGHGGTRGSRGRASRRSISSACPIAPAIARASCPAASSSAWRSPARWSTGPSLVLGDEPTGNLDSAKTADVLALLRRFNRERGQTFVIVTHDPEVGAACDRIIRMRDGLVARLRAVAGRVTDLSAERTSRCPACSPRRFASSDDVRAFPNGRAEVVTIDEVDDRSRDLRAGLALVDGPRADHGNARPASSTTLAIAISGSMHIVMEDGGALDIPAGSAFEIPPGHDAWVVGDEPWVAVVWTSIRTYALAPDGPARAGPRHGPVHGHRRLDGDARAHR